MRLQLPPSALATILLAAPWLAACGAAPGPGRSVLLVTVDTLRADRLTPYGAARDTSPFLARFASGACLFEDALSQCGTTPQSLSSLLTGLYPFTDRLLTRNGPFHFLSGANVTLAGRLTELGYRTHAITSSLQSSRMTGVHAGFETFDDMVDESGERLRRDAAEITDRALAWLADAPDEPFFLWVHYLDPHHPYRAPRAYDELFAELEPTEEGETRTYRFDARQSGPVELTDGEVERLGLAYDREVRFVDDQLARLFGDAPAGLLDEATIVITADHGEGLGRNALIDHNDLWQAVLGVPLIVRDPGLPVGARIAEPVMLVDVLPTLFDLLGLAPPEPVRGRSLVPLARGAPEAGAAFAKRMRLAEYPDRLALTEDSFKVLYRLDAVSAYDLAADPHEEADLGGRSPRLEHRLVKAAERLRNAPLGVGDEGGEQGSPRVTEEMERELHALGY